MLMYAKSMESLPNLQWLLIKSMIMVFILHRPLCYQRSTIVRDITVVSKQDLSTSIRLRTLGEVSCNHQDQVRSCHKYFHFSNRASLEKTERLPNRAVLSSFSPAGTQWLVAEWLLCHGLFINLESFLAA